MGSTINSVRRFFVGRSLQCSTACMTDNLLPKKPQRQRIIRMCLPIIHNIDPTIQLSWSPLFLLRAEADMVHWYSASPVQFFAPFYTQPERAPSLLYWQNFIPHNTVFPLSFYYIRNIYRPVQRQQSQVPKSQSCKAKHTVDQVLQETAYATDRDDQLHWRGLRPTEPSTAVGTTFKITVFFFSI